MAVLLKTLFLILLLFMVYFFILQMRLPSCFKVPPLTMSLTTLKFKPVVKIYDVNPTDNHLHIVKSMFNNFGYHIVGVNTTNWDVLWSHPYPFYALQETMVNLQHHQKVNHFPGSGFLTKKANLISLDLKYIPKAFVMPEQKDLFIAYRRDNERRLWVQKSNAHREIKVFDANNLDLNSKGTFIQEFIDKPLLIDNKKFDIGVYVILTSIDPLRVYIYSGDVLLRFCKEKYYPFNSSNIASYVVGDDYMPIWEVPSMKVFYSDLNFTAKESLNAYLLSIKRNPKKIWIQVEEAIRNMYQITENDMITASNKLNKIRNFFELIRVDFVVDEDLNVFILEANMSPNLSAEHFPPNRLLYEQVLFSVFSITGLMPKFPDTAFNGQEIEVSNKDIAVFADGCTSQACNNSCKIQKCKICSFCLTGELKTVAESAFIEHINRKQFRRAIPPAIDFKSQPRSLGKSVELSDMNNFMERWFRGKCLQDVAFCQ